MTDADHPIVENYGRTGCSVPDISSISSNQLHEAEALRLGTMSIVAGSGPKAYEQQPDIDDYDDFDEDRPVCQSCGLKLNVKGKTDRQLLPNEIRWKKCKCGKSVPLKQYVWKPRKAQANVPKLFEQYILDGHPLKSFYDELKIQDSTLYDWFVDYRDKLITPQTDPFRLEERIRQARACKVMGIDTSPFSTKKGSKGFLSIQNNLESITIDFYQMEKDDAATVSDRLEPLAKAGACPSLMTSDLADILIGPVEKLWKIPLDQGRMLQQGCVWHLNHRLDTYYMPVRNKIRGFSEKNQLRKINVRRAIMKTAVAATEKHQDDLFFELSKIRNTLGKNSKAGKAIDNHVKNRRYYHPQDVLIAHTGVPDCSKLMYNNPVEAAQGAKKRKGRNRRHFATRWAPAYEYLRRRKNEATNANITSCLPHEPAIQLMHPPLYEVPISFFLLGYWLYLPELLDTGIPEDVIVKSAEVFAENNEGLLIDKQYLFSKSFIKRIKKFIGKRKHLAINSIATEFSLPDEIVLKLAEKLGYKAIDFKMKIFNWETREIQTDATFNKSGTCMMTVLDNKTRCEDIMPGAVLPNTAYTVAAADYSLIPWARQCKTCGSYQSRFDEKKNCSLWYSRDRRRTGRRRKTEADWDCHRCYYRQIMRNRKAICPSGYRI